MNKELEEQLLKAAPKLYSNRYGSMQETCMCWGFECSDGWFDILMEASVKIEAEIEKFTKENPVTKCNRCGCEEVDHRVEEGMQPCAVVHFLPYHFGGYGKMRLTICWHNIKQNIHSWYGIKYLWRSMVWSNIRAAWYNKVNRVCNWLYRNLNIGHDKPCWCQNFQQVYPRASQVKEKYGALRFYMHGATDEIYNIIEKAEEKSEITCESCGAPGKLRDEEWLFTLCDECNNKRQNGRAPWVE